MEADGITTDFPKKTLDHQAQHLCGSNNLGTGWRGGSCAQNCVQSVVQEHWMSILIYTYIEFVSLYIYNVYLYTYTYADIYREREVYIYMIYIQQYVCG